MADQNLNPDWFITKNFIWQEQTCFQEGFVSFLFINFCLFRISKDAWYWSFSWCSNKYELRYKYVKNIRPPCMFFSTILTVLFSSIHSYMHCTHILPHTYEHKHHSTRKSFLLPALYLELRLCASMKSIHSKARKCKFRSTLFTINCLES